MTNKKINLNTDFLDEDDEVIEKQDYTKNQKSHGDLGDKKSTYHKDDGYRVMGNGKRYKNDTSGDASSKEEPKETDTFPSQGNGDGNTGASKDTEKTYTFGRVIFIIVITVVAVAIFGGSDDDSRSSSTPINYNIDTEKIDFGTKDTKKVTTPTITSNSTSDSKDTKETTAPTTTSNSTIDLNEDDVITGQFSCSILNHNEAGRLSPSTVKKSELDTKEAELNSMDSGIDKIEAEIDSFKLNESSQSSVNTYNKKIETYNSLVNKRKTKYTEYKKLLDSYNASVDKYNSFLEKNCTRRY